MALIIESGGADDRVMADINVTPLVDVMLVLLIIFMVTAPMLSTGVELELPEAVAGNLEEDEGKLVLSIDKNQRLFLGTTPVKWADLEVKLSTNERVKVEKQLYIEADKHLPYAVVVRAMSIAQRGGAVKLMMITDPLENIPLEQIDAETGSGQGAPPAADPAAPPAGGQPAPGSGPTPQ